MLRYLFISLIVVFAHAKNSTIVNDNNENMAISQSSKAFGTNTIVIGDNNKDITINQKIELIDNSNKILIDIKRSFQNIVQNRDDISNKFNKLLENSDIRHMEKIKILKKNYEQLISSNTNIKNQISNLKTDIDTIIIDNNTQIKKLKEQIQNMENSISFLMREFYKGNLNSISFYTFRIEGAYIDSYFYKGIGISYERLYNNSIFDGIALLANLSMLSGTEENIIENLDKQFYLFDIGIKKPFSNVQTSYNIYGRGSMGYLWGDESSLYLKLGIGVEKYNDKNKIGVELNYFGILEKEKKLIKTHILGNAEIKDSKEFQHGISIAVTISFKGF